MGMSLDIHVYRNPLIYDSILRTYRRGIGKEWGRRKGEEVADGEGKGKRQTDR